MAELDFNVKVEKPFLVRPAEQTQRRPFFLSNFDQNLVFTVETIHFFGSNGDDVAQTVASALSKLLVTYDYMGGRLKLNSDQGRLEIDCNGEGALFAAASCELRIDQLPGITYPNPAFAQFILQEYGVASLQDLPLLFLQVTRFACGGFAIGLGTNHILLDGFAAVDLMKNLASIAKGQGLAVVPQTDRSRLMARSPLQISHEHLEFTKSCNIPPPSRIASKPSSKLSFKLFPISAQMLTALKQKARHPCTSFEALTAHLWRAHTIALDSTPDRVSTVLFAVDVRSKMVPPLPKEFAGNAVFPGYARATAGELCGAELSWCVQQVQEGISRVTDEYVRSAIDWLEVYKGVPCADRSIVVSPWKRLAFEEVEYPWGKPLYSGPVINSWMDFVLLLPNTNNKKEGLNVFIALQEDQMDKFSSCLYADC